MSRQATGITETDESAMNIKSQRQIDRKTDNTSHDPANNKYPLTREAADSVLKKKKKKS